MTRMSDAAYRDLLAGLFALVWIALAIDPLYRHDWMLENILVVVCAAVFVWRRKAINVSKVSATLVFVYFCCHEVGSHYTYSEVPYDAWARALTGRTINELFGWERNHFDRLVHYLYGFLLSYPMRELYVRMGWLHGRLTFTFPVAVTLAFSAMYEIFEWWAAEMVGGDLGVAYLGTQGDVWDAQKDMGLAGLGAVLAIVATLIAFHRRRPAWDRPDAE